MDDYNDPVDEELDAPLQEVRGNRALAAGAVVAVILVLLCILGAALGAIYFFNLPGSGAQPLPAAPDGSDQDGARANPQNNPGLILKTFTFDQPEGWATGGSDDQSGQVTQQVADGRYTWRINARQPVNRQSYLLDFQPGVASTGYQISVDARVVEGPADALYGICFHYESAERYWEFLVDDSGRAVVAARDGARWTYPGGVQVADAPVQPGGVNVLTIQVTPKTAAFFVNGSLVAELAESAHQETTLLSGSFGLAIDLGRAGEAATIEFDNFVVSAPGMKP